MSSLRTVSNRRTGHKPSGNRREAFTYRDRKSLSGFLSEKSCENVGDLRRIPTPQVTEKAAKLLRFLARNNPIPGSECYAFYHGIDSLLESAAQERRLHADISETPVTIPDGQTRLLSAGWAQGQREIDYLLRVFLRGEGYLIESSGSKMVITPKGWELIEALPDLEGKICFVAMWFDESMQRIWLGPIREGVVNVGYQPFRVDNKEHNNDVTEEIIAGIRVSKFVLADFTGHRGGVYYEAGFAAGLGKRVIRTIRKDQIKDLHFDTRQLNHIAWEETGLREFSKAITNRIVATIGKGPYAPEIL